MEASSKHSIDTVSESGLLQVRKSPPLAFLTQPYDQTWLAQAAALGLQETVLGLWELVLSENHSPGLLSASQDERLWLSLRQH